MREGSKFACWEDFVSIVVYFDKPEEMNLNQESSRTPEPGTQEGAQETVSKEVFKLEIRIFFGNFDELE